MSDNSSCEFYKIVIVGGSCVGKTQILRRLTTNSYSQNFSSTIGIEHSQKNILIKNGQLIKTMIWDTAGQERFKSISAMYFKGSKGVIMVFDITDPKTFDAIPSWLQLARKNAGLNVPIILVANKIDTKEWRVPKALVMDYYEREKILFEETSALTGEGIEEMFFKLVENIVDVQNNSINNPTSAFLIPEEKPEKKCCNF